MKALKQCVHAQHPESTNSKLEHQTDELLVTTQMYKYVIKDWGGIPNLLYKSGRVRNSAIAGNKTP